MEEKKNHSSLPSNYVSLAQLQERWFNQHNKPQHQPQNPQPPKQTHHQVMGTASQSQPQKQYVVKNRGAVQVASDDHRESEAGAGIGDKTGDVNGNKTSEWKKKKWNNKMKLKTKTEEKRASGAAAKRDEEAEKRTVESDLKENKNNDTEKDTIQSETKEKNGKLGFRRLTQQRVRVSSINSANSKPNGKLGKMNNGFRRSQSQRNGGSVATEEESVEEKVRVSSMTSGNGERNRELGKMKNGVGHFQSQRNGDSVTTDSVEERIKVSSMNSGNAERNGKLGKIKNGFRRSQSHWNRKVEMQRREKMVWVKKNEIVDEIET